MIFFGRKDKFSRNVEHHDWAMRKILNFLTSYNGRIQYISNRFTRSKLSTSKPIYH